MDGGKVMNIHKNKLEDETFIQKVVRCLKRLENVYPKHVSEKELKKEFGDDFERIRVYLKDPNNCYNDYISGTPGESWMLNNWNPHKTFDLIARVENMEMIKKQTEILSKQNNITKNLVYIYLIIATIMVLQAFASYIELLNITIEKVVTYAFLIVFALLLIVLIMLTLHVMSKV